MKQQFTNFIGIDISKNTLDVSMIVDGRVIFYKQIKNTCKDIDSLYKGLKKSFDINEVNTVFCMEHTGIYGNRLVKSLSTKAILWFESGTHIKRSMGVTRGKNDKLDSQRIADFAYTNIHKIKAYSPPRKEIKQLKILTSERRRYLKCKKQLVSAIGEQTKFLDKGLLQESKARTKHLIKSLDKQIKNIEKQILQEIKADQNLTRVYKILMSVEGVGFVTALEMIVTTEEFRKINDPKKFACYSGVVPFEHSSGTSVRGKNRVSNMANKTTKATLHMAALSSIQMKGELREYYLRKVEQGKNKMSVINAVRNKIIQRAFACVRENRLYQKKEILCLVNP